jgi:general nucleoside transport system permease protein
MRKVLAASLPSLLSIFLALLTCFVAVIATRGFDVALDSFTALFWGAFGDFPRAFETSESSAVLRPLGESLNKASVLLFTGLSVAIAFRVGLFNIGAQGQLMWGALVAALLGAHVSLPSFLHVPLCLLAAGFVGGLYALLPAILKTTRGVHEVFSTIMLNWIAISIIEQWLVMGPLKATASGVNSISGTPQILESAQLPKLLGDGSRLHIGIILAILSSILIHRIITKKVRGFEWRVIGDSPSVAETAGINVAKRTWEAMFISGCCAGLAGAMVVLGTEFKYPPTIHGSYGFDGIAMALLAQGNALATIATSIFFGALNAGGTRMQLFGVHKSLPELISGLALLLVAAKSIWISISNRLISKGDNS